MPEFDKELRDKVLRRDQGVCQITGSEEVEVAHVPSLLGHRGMGSKKSVNIPKNLITLKPDIHNKVDKGQIIIKHWDPDDKENGLKISVNDENVLPKELIEKPYFYRLPTEKLCERWFEVQQEMESNLSNVINSLWDAVKCLKRMKEEKVDGRPLWRGSGAKTWAEYYDEFVRTKWDQKALGTANRYISAYSALEPWVKEDEWPQIRPGNAVEVSGIIKDTDDEKTRNFVELTKGRREDLEKEIRDYKITQNNSSRVPDCKDCEQPKKIPKLDGHKLGSKGLTKCPISGYILESMSRDDARNVAEDFNQRRQCYHAKD